MASTRSRNCPGDFRMEQVQNSRIWDASTLLCAGRQPADQTMLPGAGLVAASRLPAEHLANNYVDIENFLHGTGTTDLINSDRQQAPFLQLRNLQTLHLYDANHSHASAKVMPAPLVIEQLQRPALFQK